MRKMVTGQYLLEGSVYALEQCGLLLRSAVRLYKQKEYANALVLASFAREEIGRSRILRELRKGVISKKRIVTVDHIRKECDHHLAKQIKGQLSITQRFQLNTTRGRLIAGAASVGPAGDEAREKLEALTKLQAKNAPKQRYLQRLRALYVEPDEAGMRWNRPSYMSAREARQYIQDVGNDYSLEYHSIQQGKIKHRDIELFTALDQWGQRPTLPKPVRPSHFDLPPRSRT